MPAESSQTLSRAIAILDCFTQDKSELGVREIARMVELSSSATGRLLAAMKELGVLSQNPDTRAYSLGARVLTWAGTYNAVLDVRNRALPAIQELHQTTREFDQPVYPGRQRAFMYRASGKPADCAHHYADGAAAAVVCRFCGEGDVSFFISQTTG